MEKILRKLLKEKGKLNLGFSIKSILLYLRL